MEIKRTHTISALKRNLEARSYADSDSDAIVRVLCEINYTLATIAGILENEPVLDEAQQVN